MKITANTTAIIACLLAVPLCVITPWLAIIPLALFLILCLTAPFFPQWGFFLPIISKSITKSRGIALTFDDGPSPISTPVILKLLNRFNLQATFFVIGEKAARHPELIKDIISQGHTIGNHSWKHDNFLMLRSLQHLKKDIQHTQEILQQSGVYSTVFRPPAGITNPRLKYALSAVGLTTVTFSCRAFDYGNKKITNLAARILHKLQPADILLLHDIPPETETDRQYWENELEILLSTLSKENYDVQPLENLIGQPVMI